MADIQEIPLDFAEEVQDIVEDEMKAEEESGPVALEEVKPVMKPKPKGRPNLRRSRAARALRRHRRKP